MRQLKLGYHQFHSIQTEAKQTRLIYRASYKEEPRMSNSDLRGSIYLKNFCASALKSEALPNDVPLILSSVLQD